MLKYIQNTLQSLGLASVLFVSAHQSQAADVLYDQDFESPVGFVNEGSDFNKMRPVNALYGDQPPGFKFAQTFTVETLFLTGNRAFGSGYKDLTGVGGNYAIAMLSDLEDDRLGLSFDVGDRQFLNLRVDISSVDTSGWAGFPNMGAPKFRFTLYDNPDGALTVGEGPQLDSETALASASPRQVLDWTSVLIGLDASGSTNGKVTLQIDLLEGDYAAFDNLRIAASDKEGDVGRRYAP